jgi:hypothetical protein
VTAIPPGIPSSLRDRLTKIAQYGNEPSLHKRLRLIVRSLSQPEKDVICDDIGLFIDAVRDTRNYLTHLSDPEPDQFILEGEQLYRAQAKLRLLITMMLLKYIGLPAVEVLERIRACERFDTRSFHLERPRPTGRAHL